MDNLPFLRSLNNECIDLIAIDPPFAANETFTSQPRPPISKSEFSEEKALAKKHGVRHNEGIGETRVRDVWNWDEDIYPDWLAGIEDNYPPIHRVIQVKKKDKRGKYQSITLTGPGISRGEISLGEELRQKNADAQHAYKGVKDMVHIGKAIQFANEHILKCGVQSSQKAAP